MMAKKKVFDFGLDALAATPVADPVTVQASEQRRGFLYVPIGELAPDPGNPEGRGLAGMDEKFDSIVASVKRMGVLTPLVVVPVTAWPDGTGIFDDGVEYVVKDGNRRLAAALLAGLERLPVVLRPELASDGARTMLHANLTALDLTPIETAVAMRSVLDTENLSQKDLADELGLSAGHVSRLLALLELPDDVQDLVQSGKVSARSVYDQRLVDPQVQTRAAQIVIEDGSDWTDALRVAARRGSGGRTSDAPAKSAVGRVSTGSSDPTPNPSAPAPDQPTADQTASIPGPALEQIAESVPAGNSVRRSEWVAKAASRRPSMSEWVKLAEGFVISGGRLGRQLKPALKVFAKRGAPVDPLGDDRFHALWAAFLAAGSLAADAGEVSLLTSRFLDALVEVGYELSADEQALLDAGEPNR
jgi:ParB family chromosome partitioning protein